MGLIIEGPDASGKSTLARVIAKASGAKLHLSGPSPKNEDDMRSMVLDQAKAVDDGKIIDRVSCISQQIYREGLFFRADLQSEAIRLAKSKKNLLVYCRPPDTILHNPRYHEWKDYDTEEWKATVLANQASYVRRYDFLMASIPRIVFDWTDESSHHIQSLLCEFENPLIKSRLIELAHGGR